MSSKESANWWWESDPRDLRSDLFAKFFHTSKKNTKAQGHLNSLFFFLGVRGWPKRSKLLPCLRLAASEIHAGAGTGQRWRTKHFLEGGSCHGWCDEIISWLCEAELGVLSDFMYGSISKVAALCPLYNFRKKTIPATHMVPIWYIYIYCFPRGFGLDSFRSKATTLGFSFGNLYRFTDSQLSPPKIMKKSTSGDISVDSTRMEFGPTFQLPIHRNVERNRYR